MHVTVFSLNFSSAGKGPFMASKTKKYAFSWGGGGGGGDGKRGMAPLSLRNLGAEFSETLFSHVTTYFMQIGHCYLKTTIPITSLCLQCSLSKMCDPQKEKLCILQYFSIYIYSFSLWESDQITITTFSRSTLFNLSKPSSGCRW